MLTNKSGFLAHYVQSVNRSTGSWPETGFWELRLCHSNLY